MQILCLHGTRMKKPRMKREPRKQQLTVTLSDCTRSSSVANAKIYVLLYSFRFAYFEFEGNFQVQAPGGLYPEGRFNGRFFCVWGAYIWRGLFSEFHGILPLEPGI